MIDLHRLSPLVAAITPSATVAITTRAKELRRAGVDVIGLGAGEPDFDTPSHIVEAAIQGIRDGNTRYMAPDGTLELKEAIRDKFLVENGIEYSLDEIAASCGGKHSIHNLFTAVLAPGDEVIIPTPYWVSYPEQVRIAGGTPVFVEATADSGFRVDPEAVKKAITDRTRVLVLNSPSNPTGAVYPRAEIEALVDIAIEHGILVLSDEVYEHLLYEGASHHSPAAFSPEARRHVVTMNSVSKTYAMTGWRVGYMGGPAPIMRAVARLQSHQSQNPASPSQAAAVGALRGGLDAVAEMRDAFDLRRGHAIKSLESIPGIRLVRPAGAFYAFPDARDLLGRLGGRFPDTTQLCAHLLDAHNVACVPGAPFGAPTCFRISFALATDDLIRALDRIGEGIDSALASTTRSSGNPSPC